MKKCSKCSCVKALKYFSFRSDTKKYRGQCRECTKGYKTLLRDRQADISNLYSQGLKICGACQLPKELSKFSNDKSTKTGKTSECKKCKIAWNSRNKEKIAKTAAKYRYGISDIEYDSLMTVESCQVCGVSFTETSAKRAIDHCHDTGRVRGMICYTCNIGLGHFKDDIDILQKAIEYLHT